MKITMRKEPGGKRVVTVDGRTMTITEWCAELGLNREAVASRIKNGWEMESVFGFAPPPKYRKIDLVGRRVADGERTQRGCIYCLEYFPVQNSQGVNIYRMCPYDRCPYHKLDSVATYGEYIKKTNLRGFAEALEMFVTSRE